MPWCDIIASSDWTSLWYITNSPTGHVSGFDPHKPTILFIHNYWLDSKWMRSIFYDVRFREDYNMIAPDMRCCGQTKSTPSGKQDTNVWAADIAHLHHRMRLPPVHVFASEPVSTHAAMRFAALFPEKVLSLTLTHVPPPRQLGWLHSSADEANRRWSFAKNQSEMEASLEAMMNSAIGMDQAEIDVGDEVFEHYLINYPPTRRSRFIEHCNLVMNRGPIESEVAAAITVPTLMIHGEKNPSDPIEYAHAQAKELVNVPGGAQVVEVKGGRGLMNIIPIYASIVNSIFARFLSRHIKDISGSDHNLEPPAIVRKQSPQHPDLVTPLYTESVSERMARALRTQARFASDPSIAQRDPRSPLSFSRVSPELEYQQMESINLFTKGQSTAFTPLGPDGGPLRKWSQRHDSDCIGTDGDNRPSIGNRLSASPLASILGSSNKPKDRVKGNDSGNKLKYHSNSDEQVDYRSTSLHNSYPRPTSIQSPLGSDTPTQRSHTASPLLLELPAQYGPEGQQLVSEATQQLARVIRITNPIPHSGSESDNVYGAPKTLRRTPEHEQMEKNVKSRAKKKAAKDAAKRIS